MKKIISSNYFYLLIPFVLVLISLLFFNISLILSFIISIVITLLLFLSYFDLKKMEVHNIVSMVLLIFLFITNILLFLFKGSDYSLIIGNSLIFSPYQNFLGALLLGLVFQLIVLISKEKALGQGDVRIAMVVGLIIGYNNLLLWLYITIFSALFYAFYAGVRTGKFKGLHIPFVPFMILGVLVVFALSLI